MSEQYIDIDEKLREKNFVFFENRYGFKPHIDEHENELYYSEKTGSDSVAVFIKNGNITGDLRLNSIYDPDYEAARWAENHDMINRKTTIALLGVSNGSYIRALRKRYRPDTVFFILEPDESFFSYVCGVVDLSDIIIDPDIHIYLSEEQINSMSSNMIDEVTNYRTETVAMITPFYAYNDDFVRKCAEIERVANSTRTYQKERARDALRCRMYSWNHLRNAYFLSDLGKVLPEDMPAIIVSAGPSLRKNVEVLRKIKGKAFIICTDRAVKLLDEFGIVPDAITSVDAQKSASFIDYEVAKDVPLICSHQVNIDTQKLCAGRCVFYHQLEYEKTLFGGRITASNGLDQGGNVAGGSFVVCKILGVKTIILIGQDLAYIDGKHHADNDEVGAPRNLDGIEVEAVDGSTVISNDMWLSFKDFFERQIAQNPDLRVIDATEGGAKIYGTEIMTLEDVANNICKKEYDIKGFFDNLPPAMNEEEYKVVLENEKEWIKDLEEISEISVEVEDLCRQLLRISKYQDIADPKVKKKLEKLDDLRISIIFRMPYIMMEEYWIEDMYQIPDFVFVVRNNEEAVPVFENAVKFYHQLPEDCKSLKEEMEKAIKEGEKENAD